MRAGSIDDSIQWLHNFERIQELQALLVWPSIAEMEQRAFVPEVRERVSKDNYIERLQFLKLALSRQFCEHLLAHPRRRLVHEGNLINIGTFWLRKRIYKAILAENQRQSEVYAFLFNDMLLLTKTKKGQVRTRVSCRQNALLALQSLQQAPISRVQSFPVSTAYASDPRL